MQEKAQAVAWAVLGAVVVVTKSRSYRFIGFLLSTCVVAGVTLSCAVELSESTPGAAQACVPTALELADADTIMTSYLQSTTQIGSKKNCGECHLTTSGEPASAKFGILAGTDTNAKTANWCAAYEQSENISGAFMQSTHPGGVYSATEIQDLMTWAASIAE